jgi:hypothetical protein
MEGPAQDSNFFAHEAGNVYPAVHCVYSRVKKISP